MKGVYLNFTIRKRKDKVIVVKTSNYNKYTIHVCTKNNMPKSQKELIELANNKILAYLDKRPLLKNQLVNRKMLQMNGCWFWKRIKKNHQSLQAKVKCPDGKNRNVYIGVCSLVETWSDAQIKAVIKEKLRRKHETHTNRRKSPVVGDNARA